jgi:hypothetical protein
MGFSLRLAIKCVVDRKVPDEIDPRPFAANLQQFCPENAFLTMDG